MGEPTPAGVPIAEAAEQLGVTIELLRKRAQRGTMPAYKVDGRWFVVLDTTPPIVQPSGPGQDVQDVSSRTGQSTEPPPRPRAVTPAAMSQLEAIRDEWLQPLIEKIGTLERTLGRTEEQRDAAVSERDELRAEVELLREIRQVAQADDDPAPIPVLSPTAAPGREQGVQGPEMPPQPTSRLGGRLRRLFGRS